jgi:hypothetical protein
VRTSVIVSVCEKIVRSYRKGDKSCYVMLSHVSLLGTTVTRLRRGGEGDFLGNGGERRGMAWTSFSLRSVYDTIDQSHSHHLY